VDATDKSAGARSLSEAIDEFRRGNFSHTRLSRLSDLSREDALQLSSAWSSIPETNRADLVRRLDGLSEERVDVNFRRALRVALDDVSPVVRQLAIAGLWEDESTEFLGTLEELLMQDPSPDVRAEAARALERYAAKAAGGDMAEGPSSRLRELLLRAITDSTSPYGVQRRALESLGPLGGDDAVSAVITESFHSGDHGLQCSALYAMGKSLQARWLPAILGELDSDDDELRFEAARAAGILGASDALPLLLDAARDDDAEVRHAAIAAIGQVGGRGAERALERLREDAGDADLELIDATIEDVNTLLEPFQST
jgi:HEAT repeat protein